MTFLRNLFTFLLVVFWGGCVTVDQGTIPSETDAPSQGVYHKANRGETLWRIAHAYNVDLKDIIKSNNIPDVAQIEENQLVFIPGRSEVKEITEEIPLTEKEFDWPVKGKIFSYFGQDSSKYFSDGINIEAKDAEMVKAAREGLVVFADYLSGFAYTIMVDHFDGYMTVYALNGKMLVSMDEHVAKGQAIAKVGQQGQMSFLHFQIRRKGMPLNPLFYLP